MKKVLFSIIAIAISLNVVAQKNVTLTIKHKLGANPFAFTQASQNNLMHDFKITRVDYYMSGFTIIHDGGMQMVVPAGKYILVKGDNNVVANLGNFNVTNVEGIKFHIGVEAPTNNADPAQWLAPHPLSPQSPSMHWGWSSGYRFIALEGMAGATFNTNFQMHGLGNVNYFEQTVTVAGVNSGNDITINLDADYNQALKGININAGPIDHGVNATDLTVLQNFRDYVFSAGAGFPLPVSTTIKDLGVDIYPNPSIGSVHLKLNDNSSKISSANIIDISGKTIQEISLVGQNSIDFQIATKGFYIIKLYNHNSNIANQKLIIE
jgi:hypothetical protein